MELPPLPASDQVLGMALIMICLFIVICWLFPSVDKINLSEKDAEIFFNELENPKEPNEDLKNAVGKKKENN